jgi:uncharacterized membrane protein YfcA
VRGGAAGDLLLVAAGLGAGTINGVAGGGTLVSFPALLALGVPALQANVTSTLGIWPGYLGGVAGFRDEIQQQRSSAWLLVPAAVGAAAGGVLLLTTPSSLFRAMAPYLVLAACVLFALQPLAVRLAKARRAAREAGAGAGDAAAAAGAGAGDAAAATSAGAGDAAAAAGAPGGSRLAVGAGTALGSVYGGYFGAGLGVVLLALLGWLMPDDLVRTNGLRAAISLVVNTAAALVFLVAAHVAWAAAGLLAGASLVGGYLGARLARRLPPVVFRVVVVSLGLVTAIRLLV